jgi:hypothetical protein
MSTPLAPVAPTVIELPEPPGCCSPCCNPDSNYTGKTMTVSMTVANRYNAIFWTEDIITFVGTYLGPSSPWSLPSPDCSGGEFFGRYNVINRSGQYPSGGSPDCPVPPPVIVTSSNAYDTVATIFCCPSIDSEYRLILNGSPVTIGCSSFPCFNDGSISYDQTCLSNYLSSCLSIVGHSLKCNNYYRGSNCQIAQRYDVGFDEVTINVNIA